MLVLRKVAARRLFNGIDDVGVVVNAAAAVAVAVVDVDVDGVIADSKTARVIRGAAVRAAVRTQKKVATSTLSRRSRCFRCLMLRKEENR